jgi:hypothetical protein
VIATLAAFLPTFQNGFVNSWDDGPNLLANRDYRGLGWTQLRWMFTTTHMGHWIPLTWMTFGLDYLVWGMNPAGYHLTSLLLHSANAVLCYALSLGLLRAAMTGVTGATLRSGAVAAALFFAVHPLRVESVAWATERRDVLSGFFFLLTLLAYLRASASEGSARWRWLASSVACAVLALLSKAIVVGLPVILILLDVYPLRRLGWRPREWVTPRGRAVLAEKIPYVMLAIVGSAVALHAQSSLIVPLEAPSPLLRIEYVLYSLGFYVWKTVIPSALSPLYELAPRVDPRELRFIVSSIAVLAVSVALLFFRRRWPAGLAVWVAYAAMVAPVSGLFQSSARLLVADRYSYLPCIGLAILFGAGVCALVRALTMGNGSTRWLGRAGAGAVVGWIVVLGALTWRQVGVWHDPGTLWTHVLAVDPRSSVAHNNLGYFLKETGRLSEAAAHAEEALRINPSFVEADVNLGDVRVRQGNLDGGGRPLSRCPASSTRLRGGPQRPGHRPPWAGPSERGDPGVPGCHRAGARLRRGALQSRERAHAPRPVGRGHRALSRGLADPARLRGSSQQPGRHPPVPAAGRRGDRPLPARPGDRSDVSQGAQQPGHRRGAPEAGSSMT